MKGLRISDVGGQYGCNDDQSGHLIRLSLVHMNKYNNGHIKSQKKGSDEHGFTV